MYLNHRANDVQECNELDMIEIPENVMVYDTFEKFRELCCLNY